MKEKCPRCPKQYQSKNDLDEHLKKIHGLSFAKIFKQKRTEEEKSEFIEQCKGILDKVKQGEIKMKKDTKSSITILICESQEIITMHEDKYRTKEELIAALNRLFEGWVKANDLHPERCIVMDNICSIDMDKI